MVTLLMPLRKRSCATVHTVKPLLHIRNIKIPIFKRVVHKRIYVGISQRNPSGPEFRLTVDVWDIKDLVLKSEAIGWHQTFSPQYENVCHQPLQRTILK